MIGIIGVVILALVMTGVYFIFSQKTTEGQKNITVAVIVDNETKNEHRIQTDAEYLGEALE